MIGGVFKDQQILCSISLSRGQLSTTNIAYYDVKTNMIYYYSFIDNIYHQILLDIIKEEKITLSIIQKDLSNLITLVQQTTHIIAVDRQSFNTNSSIEIADFYTKCTINCLINHLDLDNNTLRKITIARKYSTQFMFIPEKVSKELDLVSGRKNSFINLVDCTKTRYGCTKLKTNVLQPFVKEEEIKERHKNILFYSENEIMSSKIESVLKEIPFVLNSLFEDFNTVRETFGGLKRYIGDCKKINTFVLQCENLKKLLNGDVFKRFIESYKRSKINVIKEKFAAVFDLENIKTGLDDYLDLARKIYSELLEDISQIADSCDMKDFLKVVKTPKGVCFKISNTNLLNHPEIIRDIKRPNFATDQSQEAFQCSVMSEFFGTSTKADSLLMSSMPVNSDQYKLILLAKNKNYALVVTPEIYKLNILLSSIHNQMIEIEGEIAFNLLKSVNEDLSSLVDLCESIAEIDVSLSGYKFSRKYECCFPQFSDFICVSGSFYPPLKSSVYNNYYSDRASLLNVVTGPNMSGKSTYLKQLSYLIILSQIGYPVTGKFATFKIYTSLYIGFNSTQIDFNDIKDLLTYFTSSSLIMIDEPGKGYDTNILMAFYTVLFRKLLRSQPTIFFITHHHRIIKHLDISTLNLLSVQDFKVTFGISRNRKGLIICEENLPKIYLDWQNNL
ncbi:MutS like protein 4 [Nosema granulosis]|uniref:MutS like protein 4 n=1 Tax=Nosema granulosis TaxID=83296 RepID=A0A9P6KYK4_9MICR|nr:MutS like protein 4 [Nosema granulosis]